MLQEEIKDGQRIEYAPVAGSIDVSSSVISVVLNEDEEVQWCWAHFPNGSSVVTGYEIIKAGQAASEREFSIEEALEGLLWPEKKKNVLERREASNKSLNRTRHPVGFLPSAFQRAG